MTFRLVTELHKKDEEVQVASLRYCMGPEADDIFKTFGLSEKFDEYFKPKVNIIRMRRIFQDCKTDWQLQDFKTGSGGL